MPIPTMWEPTRWALKQSPDLRGVMAKLDRAEHHVNQLAESVDAFLARDVSAPNDHSEAARAFVAAHEGRVADLDLSIRTGEVLYQLRSALDHIICALIRKANNTPTTTSQWPIFSFRPTKKKDIDRYNNQVAGITDPNILDVIESFQPYVLREGPRRGIDQGAARVMDHSASMLPILKELSNFDKHQAVALHVVNVASRKMVAIGDDTGVQLHIHGDDSDDLACGMPISEERRYLSAYVAFKAFGTSTRVPVVDGLRNLLAATYPIIGELWDDF